MARARFRIRMDDTAMPDGKPHHVWVTSTRKRSEYGWYLIVEDSEQHYAHLYFGKIEWTPPLHNMDLAHIEMYSGAPWVSGQTQLPHFDLSSETLAAALRFEHDRDLITEMFRAAMDRFSGTRRAEGRARR